MAEETATLPELIRETVDAVNEAARFCYFVRDAGLQQEQVDCLLRVKNRVKGFKYGAAEAGNEGVANKLFQLQCRLNAQRLFLCMWLALKRDEPFQAWDELIGAQEYVAMALRAAADDIQLEEFLEHLQRAEEVIFPGFAYYQSWSVVMRGGTCTVCGRPLAECDHIEGRVYSGRMCARVNPELISCDHIALVKDPRDRRCVITELEVDGQVRDYMTWRVVREVAQPAERIATYTARLFSNRLPGVD